MYLQHLNGFLFAPTVPMKTKEFFFFFFETQNVESSEIFFF